MRLIFDFLRNSLIVIFLGYAVIFSESVLAKSGKKTHPVKKVDVTPNTNDNDIWTLTLESDIYETTNYLNPIIDFSASNGWDVQMAFYSIPLYGGGAQNYEWDSYINLSKTFDINPYLKALAGSQNGTTLFSKPRQWHNFNYGLLIVQPLAFINLHGGPYWANKALSTTTDVVGYTTGFAVDLIKDKLSFQGDYFSGHCNVSGAVVNLFYRLLPKVQVYMGVNVPETDSGNEFYGLLGVSVASKSL